MIQTIYTQGNWAMLVHLWPNGTTRDGVYTVWLDPGTPEFQAKLDRLYRHSQYLALLVHSKSEYGCLCITKGY